MTFSPSNKQINDEVYRHLSYDNLKAIEQYINDPMTATTINKRGQTKKSRQEITSELIYYWMTALNIPFECQRWHINRLMTLIRIFVEKNGDKKRN